MTPPAAPERDKNHRVPTAMMNHGVMKPSANDAARSDTMLPLKKLTMLLIDGKRFLCAKNGIGCNTSTARI